MSPAVPHVWQPASVSVARHPPHSVCLCRWYPPFWHRTPSVRRLQTPSCATISDWKRVLCTDVLRSVCHRHHLPSVCQRRLLPPSSHLSQPLSAFCLAASICCPPAVASPFATCMKTPAGRALSICAFAVSRCVRSSSRAFAAALAARYRTSLVSMANCCCCTLCGSLGIPFHTPRSPFKLSCAATVASVRRSCAFCVCLSATSPSLIS